MVAAPAVTGYLERNDVICLLKTELTMSLNPACGAVGASTSARAAINAAANRPDASTSSSLLDHVSTALAAPVKKFSAALRHRRGLEQLARFSDRELHDLAVTRNDIAFALAEPLWRDPATAFRQVRCGGAGR
jgi:uncharacterized protein YjiS (DUF1127 family)